MDRDLLHIRPMMAGDLPSARGLLEQLGYDPPDGELAQRFAAVSGKMDHLLLIAQVEGHPVGLLHAFARPALEKPPEVVIQALVVDRRRRQSGIGTELLKAGERWAIDSGFTSIVLSSQSTRKDAHAFYSDRGYRHIATSEILRKRIAP